MFPPPIFTICTERNRAEEWADTTQMRIIISEGAQ